MLLFLAIVAASAALYLLSLAEHQPWGSVWPAPIRLTAPLPLAGVAILNTLFPDGGSPVQQFALTYGLAALAGVCGAPAALPGRANENLRDRLIQVAVLMLAAFILAAVVVSIGLLS